MERPGSSGARPAALVVRSMSLAGHPGSLAARSISLAALLLAGCATSPRWQRTELYFGLSIQRPQTASEPAHDEPIPEAAWRAFVAREIAPRFPDGFTILDADGAWSDAGRLVFEPTRVLLLLHPESARDSAAIEAIRAAYVQAFSQRSVMRTDAPAAVFFDPLVSPSAAPRVQGADVPLRGLP